MPYGRQGVLLLLAKLGLILAWHVLIALEGL